jgi:hypothetical protein
MADLDKIRTALLAKPDCLSLRQLEELAAVQNPTDPHLAGCPRCQAELALLKQFEASQPLPDEGAAVAWINSQLDRRLEQIKHPGRAPAQSRGLWSRLFQREKLGWLVPAAAVLAIAVIGFVLFRPGKEPELRAGLGAGLPVYRSQEIEIVGPSGELEQAPARLEWKPFAGAASYKVAVMEVDRSTLWASETPENTVVVPASTRAKMLASKPILWQVTAFDLRGKVLASSQTQRFVVAPRRPGVNN